MGVVDRSQMPDEAGRSGPPTDDTTLARLGPFVFENAMDAVFVVDVEADRILDANRRACDLLGYQREELRELSMSSDIHPHEIEALRKFAAEVFARGSGWTDRLSCRRKSGELVAAEVAATAVEMDGRRLLLAMSRDVSGSRALRRHAEALEQAMAHQRALLTINRAVAAKRSRHELFEAVGEAIREVIPIDNMSVILPHRGGAELEVFVTLDMAGESLATSEGQRVSVDGSIIGQVFEHHAPVLLDDLDALEAFPLSLKIMQAEHKRALACIPLPLDEDPEHGRVGCLLMKSAREGFFAEIDPSLLTGVSAAVGLALGNCLAYEEIERLKDRLSAENAYLREEIQSEKDFTEIVGQSNAITRVLEEVRMVGRTDASVLVLGETGTGKELVARAIHDSSPRRERPLVKVNSAAISAGLVESELFGHEKGAFTGATRQRTGRFELADGGTIFLDEVGELPLDTQVKLLRILQEGEFERVGASTTRSVDVRVIAATNRDLSEMVAAGTFREDLFYRLNVFPVRVPPLRERNGDVTLLANYFARRIAKKLGVERRQLSAEGLARLEAYHWPGNVRELQNVIERAVIISRGAMIEIDAALGQHAPSPPSAAEASDAPADTAPAPSRGATLEDVERHHIQSVLEAAGWKIEGADGAAKVLGLHPNTLRSRLRKLGLKRPT